MSVAETAVVYPGVELGDGVAIGDHAVVGKQPTLGRRSTATRDELPPLVVGEGSAILALAVVFAGTRLGRGVVVGDQACVRERCELGDEVVVGRGSLVENDTTIGARTRIQANAYVTAYSTLEEDVFIAPGVVTTNDNFMGRTEARLAAMRGPDDPPRRADRRRGRAPPGDRDRRGGLRRSRRGRRPRTCRPGPSSSATRRARSATVPDEELLGSSRARGRGGRRRFGPRRA